jgi:hypothetical protein
MPVIGIKMAVRVRMAGAAGVTVLMLVKDDLEAPAKGVGDAAQGLQARNVIAAFEARDHRLGHAQPLRQLLLGLASAGAKLQQFLGALGGDRCAVVAGEVVRYVVHAPLRKFAKPKLSKLAKPPSID